MRIRKLAVTNYRTLENIEVTFSDFYSAICGKNNSGKSNIFRTIRHIFQSDDGPFFVDDNPAFVHYKRDFSSWKTKEMDKESIEIKATYILNTDSDNRITRFIDELILKKEEETQIAQDKELSIQFIYKPEKKKRDLVICYNGQEIEDSYQKDEIIRKIKSTTCLVFHNSTETHPRWAMRRSFDNFFENFSEEEKEAINKKKETFLTSLRAPLKKHQKDLTELLGRLEEKYDVGLSFSSGRVENLPLEVSLNEKGVSSRLEDWGSGTRNRTMIFMHLLNAKKIITFNEKNNKVAPIVLIEEPECFLHPSAQAEFGRVLQDLAKEFRIQVIVTTHSPYLLSHKSPESNILVEREIEGKQIKQTKLIETTPEKWFEPFALALGISGSELSPFKNTFFSEASEIILVEGEIDKEYLELLKNSEHGENKLNFTGDIFPYGGVSNLENNVLVRFIKERFHKFLVLLCHCKISINQAVSYFCVSMFHQKNSPTARGLLKGRNKKYEKQTLTAMRLWLASRPTCPRT